jgi:hypothetical protein
MGLSITCVFVYSPIYSLSNSSCFMVHLNIDVIDIGAFGPPWLLMISLSTSWRLTSVYKAWSCSVASSMSLPFNPQQITTRNDLFGTLEGYFSPVAYLLAQMRPRSHVTSRSLVSHPPNVVCTYLPNHLNPQQVNPLSIIKIIQQQPALKCLQRICICCLLVQGSISGNGDRSGIPVTSVLRTSCGGWNIFV